jgi:hypothetical protein
MREASSAPFTAAMRTLLAESPGTITAPPAPPFRMALAVSRRRPPLWRLAPWQRQHRAARIGLMSRG